MKTRIWKSRWGNGWDVRCGNGVMLYSWPTWESARDYLRYSWGW